MQTVGGQYFDPWAHPSADASGWPTSSEFLPQYYAPTGQKKASSYSGPSGGGGGGGTGKSRIGAGGEMPADTFIMWDPSTFKSATESDAWVPQGMTTSQQFQQQQTQQKFIDPSSHVRYRAASVAPVTPSRPVTQQPTVGILPTTLPPLTLPTQPIAGPPSPVAVPPLVAPQVATPNASPSKVSPVATPSPSNTSTPLVRRNSRSGSIGSASGLPAAARPADIESELQQQSLYKTELCRSWSETGTCRYGTKCQFAHGGEELRPVQRHPKYKTEVCRSWAATGTCPYGTRCRFIHNKSDRAADWALLQAAAQYSPSSPTGSSPLVLASTTAPSQTEMALFSGAFDSLSLNESTASEIIAPLERPAPAVQAVPRRASIVPVAAPAPADATLLASLPPPPVAAPTIPAVLPPPSTPLPPPLATTTTTTTITTPTPAPAPAPAPVRATTATVAPTPAAAAPAPSTKKEKRLPIFQRLTAALSKSGSKSSSKEKTDSEEKDTKDKKKK